MTRLISLIILATSPVKAGLLMSLLNLIPSKVTLQKNLQIIHPTSIKKLPLGME